MSDVPAARKIIQQEEVAYAAAVSSSTGSRIAATTNFINKYQHQEVTWVLNGKYGGIGGAVTNADGAIPIFRDMEIVGFFMYNMVAGQSGYTEVDIIRHTASGAGSTIFTVRPQIAVVAANDTYLSVWYDTTEILENPAGTTVPTFASMNLDKGDALTLDLTARMPSAEGLTVCLALRPR